ncbi:cytoplasmic tyrosine-protein kinase BMX isoform X2 [Hydra vulgaris]|uniref:cytoplasmic tyrosine-protein kinase BMX isoform X2 n=1 Tax=Hydra vulgaris TaxID=6087 RepID=UPI001F5EAEBB|nr:cytoplasmic tyrosine-protein kinase BMX isoform X2 [Hydra vulgaris]
MFHSNQSQILKQEVLTKRAIGKCRATPINYKERLFVLTPTHLTYYEGNEKSRGREKGSLELWKIKAIERVDDNALKKNFCFQIEYENYILYIKARDDKQRYDWMTILREEVEAKENNLQPTHHPGIFTSNLWTCCKEKEKNSSGCKNSFCYKDVINQSARYIGPRENGNGHCEINFKVTAKFDYNTTQETDLPLKKDQEYTVIDVSKVNWWLARDEFGKIGYIPSNFVVRHFGIESEKWYHADMTRQEADQVMQNTNDGTFLVRNASKPKMYTLSFSFQGVVKHYHIKTDSDNLFYVSQRHSFESVVQLIEYHKLNSAGLATRLRFPYTGTNNPPVLLGYGVFQINRNELTIMKQIGTGQFGTVHEALWKNNKLVAVKMMKPDSMSENDFIEEAKVMQRFQHRNLITLYGVCTTHPLYIVVELMKNGSLLDYLRNNKQLLEKTQVLIDIILKVSSAMEYLEKNKFIHRDLAARNCLVGENNTIKVGDFGLARYVLDDEYTASEGSKFPVRWAAPEVIEYTKFSSKSDVWSFGVLTWEVFTGGKSPYAMLNNYQVANEVRKGYRLEEPNNCPKDIYTLMCNCWHQTPEKRPSFCSIKEHLEKLTEDF